MSVASSDSGCGGLRTTKRRWFFEEAGEHESTTTSSDLTSSSLGGSDDDEPGSCPHRTVPIPISQQRGTRSKCSSRGGSKYRRQQAKKRLGSNSNISPAASCSSSRSDLGSLLGDDEQRGFAFTMDDVVMRVYLYFQHLLYTMRRQQRMCEQVGSALADIDGRWGADNLKNCWIEATGCYVPSTCYSQSVGSNLTGFWAVPHPAVYLSLVASNIQSYLSFLQRLYPNVVGQGARDGHHSNSGNEYQAAVGEEIVPGAVPIPLLMSIMTGTAPPMTATTLADENAAPIGWNHVSRMSHGPVPYAVSGDYYSAGGTNSSMLASKPLSNMAASLIPQLKPVPTGRNVMWSRNTNQDERKGLSTASSIVDSEAGDLNIDEIMEKASDLKISEASPNGESGYHSEEAAPTNETALEVRPTVLTRSAADPVEMARGGVSNAPTVSSALTTSTCPSSAASSTATATCAETRTTPPLPPPSTVLNAKGKFEVSEMDVLSEEIWAYHNRVAQKETTLNRKLHLRDMLYYAICPVFPMCGLYVVGSSLNGFGNDSSDMDLCLMITNKDLDQKSDAIVVLNMILSTLRHVEWVAHQQLIMAKVPILRIKFAAPFDDITVDLNANNSVAIKNTHLLCYYSSFDWRVRPLVTIVKEWAKRKGINDANRSSFTSYSLVLMVIHYLQCGVSPAVLPSLQQLYKGRFSNKCDVRSLNVTQTLPPPEDWKYNERSTLGELLIGFLNYYASVFDYNSDAISVRVGKRVNRALVATKPRLMNSAQFHTNNNWRSQWRCICIEEPFTFSNTAHSIYDEMVFAAIKGAFADAYETLESTHDIKSLLDCQPIKACPPSAGAMVLQTSYEPKSDHVVAVMVPRASGSSPSSAALKTARSGRSSSGSSQGDQEADRSRESPLGQLFKHPNQSGGAAGGAYQNGGHSQRGDNSRSSGSSGRRKGSRQHNGPHRERQSGR